MCGIIGALRFGLAPVENDKVMRKSALLLTTHLMENSEPRGKDATGMSMLFDDGKYVIQKMGVSVKEFMTRFGGTPEDFDGFLKIAENYDPILRIITGHCRKTSVGSVENINNHPIKAGNIVGVHNGTLKNHAKIFKNLDCKRDGVVDSEAIFRLLEHSSSNGQEPFTLDGVHDSLTHLDGSFSIIAYSITNPNQVVVGRDGRPAEFCLLRDLNTLLIASDKTFIESAIFRYNILAKTLNKSDYIPIIQNGMDTWTLPIDEVGIFDLTREIGPDTKVQDLIDHKKLPIMGQRKWKQVTTTANNYTRTQAQTAATVKKTPTVDTQTGTTGKTMTNTQGNSAGTARSKGKKVAGRIWNNTDQKFVVATVDPKKASDGNTIINVEKDSASSVGVASAQAAGPGSAEKKTILPSKTWNLTETSQQEAEDYTRETVIKKVKFLPVDPEAQKDGTEAKASFKVSAELIRSNAKDKINGQKAVKANLENILRMEDDAEVANLCGISLENLGEMTTVALANRLAKQFFSDAFLAGYLTHCEAEKPTEEPTAKAASARRHIRVLKTLVKGMGGEVPGHKLYNPGCFVTSIKGASSEITKAALDEIFNKGDYRDNRALQVLAQSIG